MAWSSPDDAHSIGDSAESQELLVATGSMVAICYRHGVDEQSCDVGTRNGCCLAIIRQNADATLVRIL